MMALSLQISYAIKKIWAMPKRHERKKYMPKSMKKREKKSKK
jgi:hypothetical protein